MAFTLHEVFVDALTETLHVGRMDEKFTASRCPESADVRYYRIINEPHLQYSERRAKDSGRDVVSRHGGIQS